MIGYKDGMEEDWECWEHGGTCHNDKPGHWGEQKEGMTERTQGGTCHNDKPSHLKGSRGGGCVVWLFLAFSFCCWGKDSGGRGRGTIFFTFRFAFSFA